MKKVFVSNVGNAHKGICPLSFYKLSSSFLPLFTLFVHQSVARYLPLVLESPKFGESLSPDNIIFNITLFLILRPIPLSVPLKKSLFCFLYTIKYRKIYHVLVSFVCVSSVTSGGVTDMFGLIAFKAKFTLVSSIQYHLLKIGK